jgi:hypothetical protein
MQIANLILSNANNLTHPPCHSSITLWHTSQMNLTALSTGLLDSLEQFDARILPLGLYASDELVASKNIKPRYQEWQGALTPCLTAQGYSPTRILSFIGFDKSQRSLKADLAYLHNKLNRKTKDCLFKPIRNITSFSRWSDSCYNSGEILPEGFVKAHDQMPPLRRRH